MKFKDDIILDKIKPFITKKEYEDMLSYRNKFYKVVFVEAQNTSGDYSIDFDILVDVFYFLKSNLIINILGLSNIFDFIEVYEIIDSTRDDIRLYGTQSITENLLFKLTVRDLY